MSTNFFTNEKDNTLLEKIQGVFEHRKVHFFDAFIGYFRASGYFRIRNFIEQTPQIRILVGINIDKLHRAVYLDHLERSGMCHFYHYKKDASKETKAS